MRKNAGHDADASESGSLRRPTRMLRSRALSLTAVGATSALALVACGSAEAKKTAKPVVGAQLTASVAAPPTTLNPELTGQDDVWFEQPAYEPLIVINADGSYSPGLATSWHYVGHGNKTFVLHLRKGVRFSDGSRLTADDVVKDLKYVVSAKGQEAPGFVGDTFTAVGRLTVRIKMTTPNPDMPAGLTENVTAGDIISPRGLASPSKLGSQTFGAGPYELDPAMTVAGDHYTYVPNPYYYDKAAVHWKKIVVRVITTPQSTLSAMQTGQVNLAEGDPTTLASAKQDGLHVTVAPFLWIGVTLADRGGTLVPALRNVQVRRALNYATNRAAITSALFRGLGEPTDQPTVPGGSGYEAALNKTYPYDPAKAKALLAAAGYPNGFSLTVVATSVEGMDLVAQALAQQWKAVGVTMNITDDANPNQYETDAFDQKNPAFMTAFGEGPINTEGPALFLPAALFNPFHTASTTLQKLYDEDAAASGTKQQKLDQRVEAFLVNQAWFVPVTAAGLPNYATKNITGTKITGANPLVNLYEVAPAR